MTSQKIIRSSTTTPDAIRVLSVDDNPMIKDVISMLIPMMGNFTHVGHFLSESGVLEKIQIDDIKLLVLDYEMPGTDTLGLLRKVKAVAPDCNVLMLSAHARPEIVEACRRAGASGYVIKDSDPMQIVQAARTVAAGGTSFMATSQAYRFDFLHKLRGLLGVRGATGGWAFGCRLSAFGFWLSVREFSLRWPCRGRNRISST